MLFRQVTDPDLAQNAYLIGCQKTGEALIIDPERDVDRYFDLAAAEGLELVAATETHIHADFLSGLRELGARGVKLYLSDEGPADWKYFWAQESEDDVEWLHDGDRFSVGKIELEAWFTPGHTPEHLSFVVTDHGGGANEPMGIASGDFVFVGDLGRPDLLETAAGKAGAREPSARTLYGSVVKFLELPDHLQIWPGHGAGSACGKALGAVPMSTVGYEKRNNASILVSSQGEEAFVESILDGQPEPPLYFGRMKVLNKEGAEILGELPSPRRLESVDELPEGAALLDTRADRTEFMAAHLAGAIWAPIGSSLPAVAGSYLEPEEEIVLIADEANVDRAVRALVRIGLDRVVAVLSPSALESAELVSTRTETFASAAADFARDDSVVLDVRGAAEHAAGAVAGSINVAHTRLKARLDEVPRDRKLFVHCRSGQRAAFAASMLEREGYDVVFIDDLYSPAAA